MEDSDTSFCVSTLLCQENESCLNEQGYEENTNIDVKPYDYSVSEDEEDEYFENLFRRETCFGSKGSSALDDYSDLSQTWLKSARLDAVDWIFNTRAVFGFHFRTAYLSITYFDRFISKRYIDQRGKMWAIRLLSVACLSLAAKMEECDVPLLSEFPTQDFGFESNVIQRMELLVLSTLEWKMGSITPFSYLSYFINKFFGDSRPKGLVSSAVELIVAMTKETNLIDSRPSIIAAAAVLAAFDNQLPRKIMELKMSVISFWQSDDKEHMYSSYNLMQEIGKRKVKTPELSITPNVLSIHSGSHYLNENISYNSAAGTKRRLTFNESDHSSPVKKVHRT